MKVYFAIATAPTFEATALHLRTGWSKKADTRETVWVSAFLNHPLCVLTSIQDDILSTPLVFNSPTEGFPWNDLRKILRHVVR